MELATEEHLLEFHGRLEVDKKGYLEDRRLNANGDPYVIAMLMIDSLFSSF